MLVKSITCMICMVVALLQTQWPEMGTPHASIVDKHLTINSMCHHVAYTMNAGTKSLQL